MKPLSDGDKLQLRDNAMEALGRLACGRARKDGRDAWVLGHYIGYLEALIDADPERAD